MGFRTFLKSMTGATATAAKAVNNVGVVRAGKSAAGWGIGGMVAGGAVGYMNVAQDRAQGNMGGIDYLEGITRGALAGAVIGFAGRSAYMGGKWALGPINKASAKIKSWWNAKPPLVESNSAFKVSEKVAANVASIKERVRSGKGTPHQERVKRQKDLENAFNSPEAKFIEEEALNKHRTSVANSEHDARQAMYDELFQLPPKERPPTWKRLPGRRLNQTKRR